MTLSRACKTFLVRILRPVLVLVRPAVEDGRRLWAHAQFSAALPAPLDPSVVVMAAPQVLGTRRIRVGRDLLLYPGLYLETIDSGSIEIGDGVVISRGVHIVSFARITIGAGSMIGEYSGIRDANHLRKPGVAIRDAGHTALPISIGKEVWIGRQATILPGVSIGDGATVGANAVVTKDVPAGAVVAGVPARPIGKPAS